MTINKNGNKWRIREMRDGQRCSIALDHKPTNKEARALVEDYFATHHIIDTTDSFRTCATNYILIKENVLSPTTIREYYGKLRRFSDNFLDTDINQIKSPVVQEEINILSGKCKPKTVKDMYGFISSVLKMYQDPVQNIRVTLPTIQKEEPYIPSDDDIKTLLKAAEGTHYEIAIRLGLFGLRRSEICPITSDDLDGNILHIHKAMVQDKNKQWIVKEYNKTADSRRNVAIPSELADMIRTQGYAFKGFPGTISNFIRRTQDKLNLPHFSLHKERHYFATSLSQMGVPEADIMKLGGWSTPHVMKSVYRHQQISSDLERQQKIADQLSEKFK